MVYKLETEAGRIWIDKMAVAQMIEEEISHFRGKVWISNHKGSVSNIMSKIGARDELDIHMDETGILVRIYVIIRFGVSIKDITAQLIQKIRKRLEEDTELNVEEISIVVTGTLSKHIAKRNIQIKG